MKLTLTSLAALLVAGSLVAATEKPATTQTPTTATDSPLVAAAKKSNRMGKKRVVITNESLKHSKGHISTATTQNNFTIAEPANGGVQVTAETKAEKERAAEREKLGKAASDAKGKQMARAAAAASDDGPYQADPAAVERQLDQQTSTAATSTSSQPQPSKHDDTQHP